MKLFGFLFSWAGYEGVSDEIDRTINPFVQNLKSVPQLSDISGKQGVNTASPLPASWRLVNFRSSKPLAGEDLDSRRSLDNDDFIYRVFIRTNPHAGTVIFASRRFSISEAAVMTVNSYVVPKLQRRNIRVAELSERLLGQEIKTDYFVTFLSADVPGYGDSLKSLALEGEDIAGANFFRLPGQANSSASSGKLPFTNFTAKRIGLRPVNSRQECGRFGTDNRIEFSEEALQELEDFLAYVGV
jgi:hypothetical protein